MIFGGLATSNSVPFCLHYTKHPAFVKTRNADAFHTAGQALCGEPLFSWLVKPFGENPSERFALSSPFRGAMSVAGYNIRCRKAMPPLKGRGGPRSGGEVRPRRQRGGLLLLCKIFNFLIFCIFFPNIRPYRDFFDK